ncbi:hypothetical protein R6Q57_002943 [Mikania cordata]
MYGTVRKSAVDASFKKLGVEILSIGDIESLVWEALAAKIGKWIRSVKPCVKVLFASEKTLCQLIFQDLGTDADEVCFMETVKAPAIQLFSFAEDVTEIVTRLVEAARGMLLELKNVVLHEPSKVPVPGGTVHPLTRKAAIRYQRATWTGVLYCLRDEGLYMGGSFVAGVSKSAFRERFKSFNAMFKEAHKIQALWTHIEQFRHPENYIKFSVEDLETAVLDFFEGKAVVGI